MFFLIVCASALASMSESRAKSSSVRVGTRTPTAIILGQRMSFALTLPKFLTVSATVFLYSNEAVAVRMVS